MLTSEREEIKREVEERLGQLKPQADRGPRVRAIVVHPHCPPVVEWVSNDFPTMYCILGGPPELIPLEEGVDLYCNGYGKLLGLTANRALFESEAERPWDVVAGTFLVMGADEETADQIDLSEAAVKKYTELIANPVCIWGYRV